VLTRRLVRPLLASAFVVGGLDALRNPGARADKAATVGPQLAQKVGLPDDPETLVKVNAGVMVVGGALLALGKAPRLASAALLGSLVPTTLAGHPFWQETDPQAREQQRKQFKKNAAMGGGLLLALLDTEGRPSLTWRAKRAAKRAQEKLPVGD
jgi:uncharacterized membrane protein YphA (DoxX/SURF4 family)